MPATRAQHVIADKAYDVQERVIERLSQAGKTSVIPSRGTDKQPLAYEPHLYQARHLSENFFAKLKQYLAIATHYDEPARNCLGAIHLATAGIWFD